eukprot:8976177-Alexandrium_andersonii.AAC.1
MGSLAAGTPTNPASTRPKPPWRQLLCITERAGPRIGETPALSRRATCASAKPSGIKAKRSPKWAIAAMTSLMAKG